MKRFPCLILALTAGLASGGDREEVYYKLWELGCDGFSTDYPSVMFKVIKALNSRHSAILL